MEAPSNEEQELLIKSADYNEEIDGPTEFMPWHTGLTDRQRIFVVEYVIDFNQTRAALVAGFATTSNSAAVAGYRLLRNVKVIAAKEKLIEQKCMSTDEALWRLSRWARGTVEPFLENVGRSFMFDFMSEQAQANMHLIKSFNDGKLEIHDPVAATKLILQMAGKIGVRKEISGPNGGPIPVESTTTHVIAPETVKNFFEQWNKKYE